MLQFKTQFSSSHKQSSLGLIFGVEDFYMRSVSCESIPARRESSEPSAIEAEALRNAT